jgi:hypothetical protein
MIYKKNDTLNFGKYKGILLSQLVDRDLGYICWCITNIKEFVLDKEMIYLIKINYKNLSNSSFVSAESLFESEESNIIITEEAKIDNIIKTNFIKYKLLGLSQY